MMDSKQPTGTQRARKLRLILVPVVVVGALCLALLPGTMGAKGPSIIQLTDNALNDGNTQIDGGKVTWQEYDGNDYEIYLYDGRNTIQLTDNADYDANPQIDGGKVTWEGSDGNDLEIFLYDGKR